MYTFNQTTFQSQGESFKTPWTIDLDGMNESETCEFKDLMVEAGEQAEPFKMVPFMADMVAAVKQDDAARTALVEQYCKENNVERHTGAVWREDLTARAKASKGGWLQAQMAAAAALKSETDPHAQRWDAHDAKGDELEKAIVKERSEWRVGRLHKDAKVA